MSKNLSFLTLFSYKKFIQFSTIFSILLSNNIDAYQLPTESEILRQSNECLNDLPYQLCTNLFLKMEKIQLFMSEQNKYKCQASVLGLQTELIEAYYFKKLKKQNVIMIPYVIKNCKF